MGVHGFLLVVLVPASQWQLGQGEHDEDVLEQPPAPETLPDWQAAWSAEHQRYYYYHSATLQTQWEAPGHLELTRETWDRNTVGKSVLVNYFAPGHLECMRTRPAWDSLTMRYIGHPSVLIANVDCSGMGRSLCSDAGISNYPTLKYGNPDDLKDYHGELELSALDAFIKENLRSCNPSSPDVCDSEERKQLEAFVKLPEVELDQKVREKLEEIASADADLSQVMEEISSKYEAAAGETNERKAEMKETRRLMRVALRHLQMASRCGPANRDACTEEEQELIQSFMRMSKVQLDEQVIAQEEMLATIDSELSQLVESLQSRYDKAVSVRTAKKADPSWRMMKAVLAFKHQALVCGPGNLEPCSRDQRDMIGIFLALPEDVLASRIEEQVGAIAQLDEELESLNREVRARSLQAERETRELKAGIIKGSGLRLMKDAFAYRQRGL